MKKIKYLLAPIVLIIGALVGCYINITAPGTIEGSGNVVTIEKFFADFNKIDIANAFKVTITRGDSFSIVIRIDDNIVTYLNAVKLGNTFKIYLDSGYSYRNVTLEADITLPDLEGLNLSGASQATIPGFDFDHAFHAVLSGASIVIATMNTGNVDISLSGASRITLEGYGEDLGINASGASMVELGDFEAVDADVVLSGASSATINISGTLNANLSGASRLYYYGNPTMENIVTTGSSTIQRLGP